MAQLPSAASETYTSGSESDDSSPFNTSEKRFKYLLEEELNRRVWAHPARLGDVDMLDLPVPAEIKAKVKAIDPCKGRCLITNATPESGIKYTYCLPVHLSDDCNMMHSIEWHWGMRMRELDLNTEYNIFPVSAQLSAIHDYPRRGPSWFLVPEDHVVDMFFSRVQKLDIKQRPCEEGETPMFARTWRGNLPELQEKTYRYRLFPMYQRMKGIVLTHQAGAGRLPKLCDVTVDVHPFNNLPWVTSHLDPKYVIMEAGRKLKMMDTGTLKWGISFDRWFDHQPILRRLLLLYEAWSNAIPAEAYQDPGFIPLVEALPENTGSPAANDDPRAPDSARNRRGLSPSSIAQWSADASAQAPINARLGVDASNDITRQDDDETMDSDDHYSQSNAW
ncbi:hypothetical protein D9619_003977 [Psilocybe cf. subviscida]|uniref:HNH nuclease domain-containing protein n=1 Tax=Psilocybe cf. subviscida TaxID=2480587 RepID=A0A8H5BRP1_9AGAR|nr:hypothetical protein D9619_003977 [Psilocybe cf. subviscida]